MRTRAARCLQLAGLVLVGLFAGAAGADLPPGFVEVRDIAPGVHVDLRYAGADNFVGAPIDGYEAERCYVTVDTARALAAVNAELVPFGLALKIFDAYRPQHAVDHFVRWAQDLADTRTKTHYYPRVAKDRLFREGYIAERSGHSRGSTVDLTIIAMQGDGVVELDMGTPFDFFDPRSHAESGAATPAQRAHRLLLRSLMQKHGFRPLAEEWWHFTLVDEPFPERYFDFPVR